MNKLLILITLLNLQSCINTPIKELVDLKDKKNPTINNILPSPTISNSNEKKKCNQLNKKIESSPSNYSEEEIEVGTDLKKSYLGNLLINQDGSFTINWQNSSDAQSYFQKFNNKAEKLGEPIKSNKFEYGTQTVPEMSQDNQNNFVFAWAYFEDIYFNKFNFDGLILKKDSEVIRNLNTFFPQPHIVSDNNGNFIIFWLGTPTTGISNENKENLSNSIFGQKFDDCGNPISKVIQFKFSDLVNVDSFSVKIDNEGNFILLLGNCCKVFTKNYYAQIFNNKMENLSGLINVPGKIIAMNEKGNFIIVGQEKIGDKINVYAQMFDKNGISLSKEIRVNSDNTSSDFYTNLEVTIDNNNNFIVLWNVWNNEENNQFLYAKKFNSQGIPLSDELKIFDYSFSSQKNPYYKNDWNKHLFTGKIVMNDQGSFIVSWTTNSYSKNENDNLIYVKAFNKWK